MDFFKKLGEQFKSFWSETTPSARIGMIATLVISVGLIIAVGIWSSYPNYVIVAENLSAKQSAEISASFDTQGINFTKKAMGRTLAVDQSQEADAKTIVEQVIGPQPEDSTSWFSTGIQKSKTNEQLAARIENHLEGMTMVDEATVTVTVAKPSAIQSMRRDSKASILIRWKPAFVPQPSLAETIKSQVATAVPGLEPENISLSDTTGRNFASPGLEQMVTSYHRQLEMDKRSKVDAMLSRMLGAGNFAVEITVDADIRKQTLHSKKWTGEEAKPRITIKQTNTMPIDFDRPSGTAGVAGNLTSNTRTSSKDNVPTHVYEESENLYDEEVTDEERIDRSINKISVAVVFQIPKDEDGNPVLQTTAAQVEEVVKNAVGFDDVRDTIKVTLTDFAEDPMFGDLAGIGGLPPGGNNDFVLEIVRNSSLGLGALFAFVIGFLMLRKMKPVTITKVEKQISPERSRYLSDLSRIARENPELLSRVITGWINADPAESASKQPDEERSAA